jgi:hypothetical protein
MTDGDSGLSHVFMNGVMDATAQFSGTFLWPAGLILLSYNYAAAYFTCGALSRRSVVLVHRRG